MPPHFLTLYQSLPIEPNFELFQLGFPGLQELPGPSKDVQWSVTPERPGSEDRSKSRTSSDPPQVPVGCCWEAAGLLKHHLLYDSCPKPNTRAPQLRSNTHTGLHLYMSTHTCKRPYTQLPVPDVSNTVVGTLSMVQRGQQL